MRALLLLLVAGCVPGPAGAVRPLTGPEEEQRALAEDAWEQADFEDLGPCLEDHASMRVAVAHTHREMFALTGYCGPSGPESQGQWEGDLRCRWGRAAGAYRRARSGGAWPFALFESPWPLLVLWGGHDEATANRLVRHEVVHWLEDCTGRGWNPWDAHGDAEVWCEDGCPGRYRRRSE